MLLGNLDICHGKRGCVLLVLCKLVSLLAPASLEITTCKSAKTDLSVREMLEKVTDARLGHLTNGDAECGESSSRSCLNPLRFEHRGRGDNDDKLPTPKRIDAPEDPGASESDIWLRCQPFKWVFGMHLENFTLGPLACTIPRGLTLDMTEAQDRSKASGSERIQAVGCAGGRDRLRYEAEYIL